MSDIPHRFDDASRAALYRVMELRRDIRRFRPGEVDEALLLRILQAATLAPSVGFSQPWAFIVVRDPARRARIREDFLRCRAAEVVRFPPSKREQYLGYKLEGICESSLNLCVVADLRDRDEVILGTTVQPESVRASVSCAVQNLWLAARAEGLGVGWVSIVEPAVLRAELALPAGVEPVAYLCIGHAEEFRARPLLDETGWRPRQALADVLHSEQWQEPPPEPRPRQALAGGAAIPPFDARAAQAARAHHDTLTKPHGSLGRLEEIAAWYAGAHGSFPPPPPDRACVAVFAADHGVVAEGVSAYPSSVTAGMVANIMAGGAAVNALAHRARVDIALVDVGVAGDLSMAPTKPVVPLVRAKVRAGTANLRREPAMTPDEALEAMHVGEAIAGRLVREGYRLLAAGEVGIGNTTSAAALICALTGSSAAEIVGVGTGIAEGTRASKIRVVEDVLARPRGDDPLGVLASLGGLELAAMCGFFLAAARARTPVVLDGFLATAAALVAKAFDPRVVDYLLASHVSAERGAAIASEALGQKPLFDLGMRLGEGTGAVLALELVRAAVEVQRTMATFSTAGIVRPKIHSA